MIKRTLLIAVVALTSAASYAASASEPFSFGGAQLGTLRVDSSVILSPSQVDMRGVWNDSAVSCRLSRKLWVKAVISISAPGATRSRTYSRAGSFVDVNCAEGGPNVGFTISARKAGSACTDGSWKPAIYSFMTTTTEPTKQLRATASFVWTKSGHC